MLEEKKAKCLQLIEEVTRILESHGASERLIKEINTIPVWYSTERNYDFEIEGLESIIEEERENGLKLLDGRWGEYGREKGIFVHIQYPD